PAKGSQCRTPDPARFHARESSCVALQQGLHVVEDDFLLAQARQVVGPFPGGCRDRAKAMLKERDLQAGVCEDATTMPLDDSDSVRISIAHKPAREYPHRDPRWRAVDESRDP